MKNKNLIALLQRLDPEAEVVKNKGDYVGPKYFPVSDAECLDVVERRVDMNTGLYYREADNYSSYADDDSEIVKVIEIV